jgi:hypothetical protein
MVLGASRLNSFQIKSNFTLNVITFLFFISFVLPALDSSYCHFVRIWMIIQSETQWLSGLSFCWQIHTWPICSKILHGRLYATSTMVSLITGTKEKFWVWCLWWKILSLSAVDLFYPYWKWTRPQQWISSAYSHASWQIPIGYTDPDPHYISTGSCTKNNPVHIITLFIVHFNITQSIPRSPK